MIVFNVKKLRVVKLRQKWTYNFEIIRS